MGYFTTNQFLDGWLYNLPDNIVVPPELIPHLERLIKTQHTKGELLDQISKLKDTVKEYAGEIDVLECNQCFREGCEERIDD